MHQDFTPTIWPEAPVPKDIEGCAQCELHKQRTRIIWGEGNPLAQIIIILDNPGAREDKEGIPFVCGTRQTLQFALETAGLGPDDVYITYLLKCRPLRKYDKERSRAACLAHLKRQILSGSFRLAFCLGDTAVRSFFEDPEKSVKSSRGIWHSVGGILTCASYHPLAVRRRPTLQRIFLEDCRMLSEKYHALRPS